MKNAKLSALLLSAALVAGCAGTSGQPGTDAPKSQRSAGDVVDDATITAKVKSALLADPDVSGLKINVDTAKGVVSLKGEVKSVAVRNKAASLAKGVTGVQSVRNDLIVTGQ